MNYLKMLVAPVAVLMALMAVGTASATTLTGAGGATLGSGTEIKAASEQKVILHPPIGDLSCDESAVSGKTTNAGSSTETVAITIEAITFSTCNTAITVLKNGTLEIHTEYVKNEKGEHVLNPANNNGTVTGSGTELTMEMVGFHCIFKLSNTSLGTVTGSATTGGNATLDISATIPRTGGRSGAFCGSTAEWTGAYKVTSPGQLNID